MKKNKLIMTLASITTIGTIGIGTIIGIKLCGNGGGGDHTSVVKYANWDSIKDYFSSTTNANGTVTITGLANTGDDTLLKEYIFDNKLNGIDFHADRIATKSFQESPEKCELFAEDSPIQYLKFTPLSAEAENRFNVEASAFEQAKSLVGIEADKNVTVVCSGFAFAYTSLSEVVGDGINIEAVDDDAVIQSFRCSYKFNYDFIKKINYTTSVQGYTFEKVLDPNKKSAFIYITAAPAGHSNYVGCIAGCFIWGDISVGPDSEYFKDTNATRFHSNGSIKNITIDPSITSIGSNCFFKCFGLESLTWNVEGDGSNLTIPGDGFNGMETEPNAPCVNAVLYTISTAATNMLNKCHAAHWTGLHLPVPSFE